jgi:hypothetical protein
LSPPSSRISEARSQREAGEAASDFYLLHAGFFFGLLFYPEDVGDIFLRNVSCLSTDYTVLYPRRQNSS